MAGTPGLTLDRASAGGDELEVAALDGQPDRFDRADRGGAIKLDGSLA